MQNRRSQIIWIIALAIAFFFILDPFRLFQSSNIPQMRVANEVQEDMERYLTTAVEPTRYVVEQFETADLVMIGETGYVKQQLEFLAELIPAMDAAGYRHLGFQYANRDDQAAIDELLTAGSFDEELANEILFNHMVIMGYQEHRAVLRAAWQVNRSKSADEAPFRIIGLSSTPNYEFIEEQNDIEDPEILAEVFADGVPDQIMADTIMERIVDPGHKGVVYTQLEHSFTDFRQTQYAQTMGERGFPNQRRTGNILADRLGDRVRTVIFHGPLQDSRSRMGYGYPMGGAMERAVEGTPQGTLPVGFTVAETPYTDGPITSDSYSDMTDEELVLSRFTDGYIILNTITQYEPVTPIPGFITEDNIDRAISEFPGPSPGEVSVSEMNEFISGTAESMARIFEEFE